MVYLWRISNDYPQSLIGEYQREGTPDRFLFKKGERILESVGVPIIKFNASIERLRAFDCLTSNAMVPLVSASYGDKLLEIAPHDVQLIKSIVVGNDGETDEFFLLNVTGKVMCINHDQSEFLFVPGTKQIMSFRRLKFIEGCLGSHGIARDSEYLSHLLVSEKIAAHLRREKTASVEFIAPENIEW